MSSVPRLAKATRLTQPSVQNALDALQNADIVREITESVADASIATSSNLRILAEGTAPLD